LGTADGLAGQFRKLFACCVVELSLLRPYGFGAQPGLAVPLRPLRFV
jgi:hypothetical protein